MSTRSLRTALAAALTLALAAPAAAQDPGGENNLGDEPPVPLSGGGGETSGGDGGGGTPGGGSAGSQNGVQLAETGSESALIALAGMGLLLAGTGLRVRLRGDL